MPALTGNELRHGRVPVAPAPIMFGTCDVCGLPTVTGADRHAGCVPPSAQLGLFDGA